ncbi:MFS transporter [Nonomuraea soli]|uniref:MFS family permease n=1 Tax=Nonomuraea soli TaxID=1032476 RepID=A0A7W0CN36_9ACTN|nr:MFS transporter [Nonomuraea soli]MBA2894074.1 MFS family permease [Nonomuraea soli]
MALALLPPIQVPARPAARWWALPVLLTAAFVTTLDFFIANVALPSIRADLHAGEGTTQLVIAGYGLAYAAGVIVAGRMGDVYGARRIFLIGLALFTLASAACGLAPSSSALVASRVVQGAAAALMAPQVLTLLGVLYPGGADRRRAFAWYGSAVGLAGVSGQVVGGLLVASDVAGLGWRMCFLINLPLGVAALVFAKRLLPQGERGRGGQECTGRSGRDGNGRAQNGQAQNGQAQHGKRARLDGPGAALIAAALVAVVLPLTEGRQYGWPWWTWLSLAASAVLLAAFVRRQKRVAQPLVDLALFTSAPFVRGLMAVTLLFGSSSGLTFVLAIHLQDRLGLDPLTSGAVFTALNAGFLVASRLPAQRPAVAALVLAGGFLLIMQGIGDSPVQLVPGLFAAGAGMGLLMSPLIARTLEGVDEGRAGSAAGVLGTVQEMGGVLGVTVTGLVYFGSSSVYAALAVLTAGALALVRLAR